MGGFQYLEKLLDFALTVERIYEGLEAKTNGFISGVSLPSFLQLIEVEQKTCLLTIRDKGRSGSLYFQAGQLIDAELEDLRGDAAALEIASWEEPEIEITPKYKKRAQRIDSPLHFILMEACRLKDERNRDQLLGDRAEEREMEEISISYEEPTGGDAYVLSADREIPDREAYSNKERNMNVQKLNDAMNEMKANIGPGLLSSSIVSSTDGQTIVDFQGNPKACALFNQLTNYLSRALKESGLPELGKYYIIDLTNNRMGIVIPLGDFWWGMVTDSQKAPLGLLLNIAIPNAIDKFEEAIVG